MAIDNIIDSMCEFYDEHETACNIAMFAVGVGVGIGIGLYVGKKVTRANNLVIPKTSDVGKIVTGIRSDLNSGRVGYFDIFDTSKTGPKRAIGCCLMEKEYFWPSNMGIGLKGGNIMLYECIGD